MLNNDSFLRPTSYAVMCGLVSHVSFSGCVGVHRQGLRKSAWPAGAQQQPPPHELQGQGGQERERADARAQGRQLACTNLVRFAPSEL